MVYREGAKDAKFALLAFVRFIFPQSGLRSPRRGRARARPSGARSSAGARPNRRAARTSGNSPRSAAASASRTCRRVSAERLLQVLLIGFGKLPGQLAQVSLLGSQHMGLNGLQIPPAAARSAAQRLPFCGSDGGIESLPAGLQDRQQPVQAFRIEQPFILLGRHTGTP